MVTKQADGVRLDSLTADHEIQAREKLDPEVISEYAEGFKRMDEFPPIVVFDDGKTKWIADGFHRYEAAKEAGNKTILADVRKGTRRDALLYSISANQVHGLRRTNADKRRAVELALRELPDHSDSAIAKLVGVSHPTVASVRTFRLKSLQPETSEEDGQVATVATCSPQNRLNNANQAVATCPSGDPQVANSQSRLQPTTRIGADGKRYPAQKSKVLEPKVRNAPVLPSNIEESRKLLRDILNPVNAALRLLKGLPEQPGTELLVGREKAVRAHLENAKGAILCATPHAICKRCKGKPDGCAQCGNLGWVSRGVQH